MNAQIRNLTKNLLNCGAFNHLSDTEIAGIQRMIIDKRSEQKADRQLLEYWHYADFFATGVPQFLYHECNMVLGHYGHHLVEMLPESEYDA
jgi:hypothetical protein